MVRESAIDDFLRLLAEWPVEDFEAEQRRSSPKEQEADAVVDVQ